MMEENEWKIFVVSRIQLYNNETDPGTITTRHELGTVIAKSKEEVEQMFTKQYGCSIMIRDFDEMLAALKEKVKSED